MANLNDLLGADAKKAAVVDDCCTLIDDEVRDKGGVSGLVIKAGYAAVKGIKPGFIKQVVGDLLPEFAAALDPLYQEAIGQNKRPGDHLRANASRAADALLGITDARATRAKSGVVKGTYEKLRPVAKKNVEAAIPRLSRLIDKYAG
jgi:Family of unknown function (DUF6918)